MARPLVLCSNDDGIHSPHLEALASRIEEFAEVIVVAPEPPALRGLPRDHAAQAASVDPDQAGRFSLSGTPVDCVYLGVLKLLRSPAGGGRVGDQRRLQPRQ